MLLTARFALSLLITDSTMKAKLTLILLALLVLFSWSDAQRRRSRKGKKSTQCHLKDVEKCLDQLSSVGKSDGARLIASPEGLDRFCAAIRQKFPSCVKDYFKKCGTPVHRELSTLILDQLLSHTTDLCRNGAPRSRFLRASPCLSTVLQSKAVKSECNGRYIATLNLSGARNDSLPSICCGYRHWEECTLKHARQQCGKEGEAAVETLVSKAMLDLPTLTCPKDVFPLKSEECSSLLAPKTAKVTKLVVGDTGVGKYNVAHVFTWLFQLD